MTRVGFDLRWKTGTLVHYVDNLLRALVAEANGEFQFVCYEEDTARQGATELDSLVELRPVPWSRYSLAGQLFLPKVIRGDGIRLFHSPFYLIPFFTAVPTIATIHDVIPFLRYTDKRGAGRMAICALNLLAAHRASAIVTVSETSRKDIVRFLRVPESKVSVAPCGVNSFVATAPNPEFCRQHAPYFACVTARHFEAKNTIVAIQAWKIFRERTGLPHKLLIAGGTSEEGRRRLLEAGGGDDCELIGFVPDENYSSFFHYAEAFIAASLYEGFGLPALEAMACGTPLISSNRASLPEVGGDAALYFDATSAEALAGQMIHVATNREVRERMICRGKVQAEKFSYAEIARRIVGIYESLLSSAN